MHPTIEDLLALRDSEGAPEHRRHLGQCSECARQVEAMGELRARLRRLPELEPPTGGWERIIVEGRRRRARRTAMWAAAAAALLVATLTAGLMLRPAATRLPAVFAGRPDDVADLMNASRELEMVLRAPLLQSPVLRPAEAARIVALEDRIAVIDTQLAAAGSGAAGERALALWSDRVELLDQLVRARGRFDGGSDILYAVNSGERRGP